MFSAEDIQRVEELLAKIDFAACDCPHVWLPCRCEDCRDDDGALLGERARKHNDRLAACACVRRALAGKLPIDGIEALIGLGEFLERAWPKRYRERFLPLAEADFLRRCERVAVMKRRRRGGAGLYHEADPWRKKSKKVLRVAVASDGHAANGIGIQGERLVPEDAKPKPEPARWPYRAEKVPAAETDRQRARRQCADRVNALLVLRGAEGRGFDSRRALTLEELASVYGTPVAERRAA